MTWDYRIIKIDTKGSGDYFAIHEVYYDEDGEVRGHTARAMYVSSESPKGIMETLILMRHACKRPILDEMDLKKLYRKRKREEAKKPAFKL